MFGLRLLAVAGGFILDGWDVLERFVETLVVGPGAPRQRRELDIIDGLPGSLLADEPRLVEVVDGFASGTAVAVADLADRGRRADLGEPFAVAQGRERSARHRGDRPGPRGCAAGVTGHLDGIQHGLGAHVRCAPPATTIRENASMMKQTLATPSQLGTKVRLTTHGWFGPSAMCWRSTRSGCRSAA